MKQQEAEKRSPRRDQEDLDLRGAAQQTLEATEWARLKIKTKS